MLSRLVGNLAAQRMVPRLAGGHGTFARFFFAAPLKDAVGKKSLSLQVTFSGTSSSAHGSLLFLRSSARSPSLSYTLHRSMLVRYASSSPPRPPPPRSASRQSNTTLLYIASTVVLVLGAAYAAVPLYRLFCQVRENEEEEEARSRDKFFSFF